MKENGHERDTSQAPMIQQDRVFRQRVRDIATYRDELSRIEYGLADIREVLQLYPDTEHPYNQEKLTERDKLLEQWNVVNKTLRNLETAHNDTIHEQAGRDINRELIDMLHMCLDSQECNGFLGCKTVDEVKAVIAKAEGKSYTSTFSS